MRHTVSSSLQGGVALLSVRLSIEASQLRQRCLCDQAFRTPCEEYFLACQSLRQLKQRNGGTSPELAEYASIIAELEAEVSRAVLQNRDAGP